MVEKHYNIENDMDKELYEIYNFIQRGTIKEALVAPKKWIINDNEALFISKLELYLRALEQIYHENDKLAERFSRVTVFNYIEKKIISFKKNNKNLSEEDVNSFFNELLNMPLQTIIVLAPISGIILSSHEEFQIGCFKILHSKRVALPQVREDIHYYISISIADVYDNEIAIYKAASAFSDFCRITHFIAGTFDKKNEIKIGLPALPLLGNLTFKKTDYFLLQDENGNIIQGNIENKTFTPYPIDNEFFCSHEKFKNIWQLYSNLHQHTNINDINKRIINAALAVGESAKSEDLRNSIIYSCIALETLLSYDEGSLFKQGIGEKIAEALAFIIATDKDTRQKVYKFTKQIYSFRSALVHGGKKKLTNDYILLNHYIRMAIADLLNNEKWNDITTIQKFYEYIQERKFS